MLRGPNLPLASLAFSPDGRLLASGAFDGSMRVWDVPANAEEHQVRRGEFGGPTAFRGVAFHPNGQSLAGVSCNEALGTSQITIWTRPFWQGRSLPAQAGKLTALAYSPDGNRVYAAGADGTLRAWNLALNDQQLFHVRGHDGPINALSVAGDRLITSGQDGTVRLWDAATGRELLALRGLGPGGGAALAGHDLVTAAGTEVKVWDGRPVALRPASALPR